MDDVFSGLDLNAVRVFVAVVEHGGFREAAQQLKLPRSTVSRRVAQLEQALGQQLLRRTTRTVSLTEVGENFHRQAAVALGALGDAVRTLHHAEAAPRGVLKVTAPQTFAELFMGGLLSGFARDFPEVRLVMELSDRFVDLVAEGFDVALRTGALADSSLKARKIGSSPFGCFVAPDYLSRRGRPRTPKDLVGHDVLAFATGERAVKWAFEVNRRREVVELKPRVTLNSFVLLQQLAAGGLGITRLPRAIVARAPRKGQLVEVLEDFVAPAVPMHALFPPGPFVAPKVRVFLDYLAEHLDPPQ